MQQNKSRLRSTNTDIMLYEIEMNKDILGFSNYSGQSKYYDNSITLVFGKMKDEMGGV